MSIYDIEVKTIDGRTTTLSPYKGKTMLIVNVASKCGLTPQYEGLQGLYDRFHEDGLEILGFPCNQFLFQEPKNEAAIAEFCTLKYNVTFPMFSKIKVNGAGRHPLYAELTCHPDADGKAGRVKWNFEKFLVSGDGEVVARFRPRTTPDDETLVSAIEEQLKRRAG